MTRLHRRKLSRIKDKAHRKFQYVSDCFIGELFSETTPDFWMDYKFLFGWYNEWWIRCCKWWNARYGQIYSMDEYWFYNNYKPQV